MKKVLLIAAVAAAVLLLGTGTFFLASWITLEIGDASLSFASREEGYVHERRAGDGDYYYNSLSADQQVLYDNIHRLASDYAAGGFSPESESAGGEEMYILARFRYRDFSLSEEEAISSYVALSKDCPSFFFFVSVRLVSNGRWFAPVIAPEYGTAEALEGGQQSVERGAAEAALLVSGAETDAAKFKAIHDYVIGSTDYEWESEDVPSGETHAKNIVGVLDGDERTGSICEGYAKAVQYLSNRAGLSCLYVTGSGIAHAWNLAEAGGKWYVIDATNDDSPADTDEYFLCADSTFRRLFSLDAPAYDTPEEGLYWQGTLPAVEEQDYGTVTLGGVTYEPWGSYGEMRAVSAENAARIEIAAEAGGLPVTAVSAGAFSGCTDLAEAVIPASVRTVPIPLFGDCRQLSSLTLPSLSIQLRFLFGYRNGVPDSLEEVVLSGGETLPVDAFDGALSLRRVVLPAQLRTVEAYAFYDCAGLREVYYMGSPSEWEQISIHSPTTNRPLVQAARFYYSAQQPPEDGNAYWHYGEAGEIVLWE